MYRFVSQVSCFLLPILFSIVLVNYFGDAGHIFYHREGTERVIAQHLAAQTHVTNVPNVNERLLHKYFIEGTTETPHTIILGSSRVMLIGQDYYQTETVLNHGLSGASIEDIIAIYQLYKQRSELPQRIILGLDPWIFNEHNGQGRWQTLASEYHAFANHENTQSLNSGADQFTQLLSLSYFQPSFRMLSTRSTSAGHRVQPTDSPINPTMTRLADGSISYDTAYREVTVTDVDSRARQFISGRRVYTLGNYDRFGKSQQRDYEALVRDIQTQGIELQFVLMPYHPIVYDFLKTHETYRKVLEFEDYVQNFSEANNITLFGSLNPHQLGLASSHFYDGMHPNHEGTAIALQTPFLYNSSPRLTAQETLKR